MTIEAGLRKVIGIEKSCLQCVHHRICQSCRGTCFVDKDTGNSVDIDAAYAAGSWVNAVDCNCEVGWECELSWEETGTLKYSDEEHNECQGSDNPSEAYAKLYARDCPRFEEKK